MVRGCGAAIALCVGALALFAGSSLAQARNLRASNIYTWPSWNGTSEGVGGTGSQTARWPVFKAGYPWSLQAWGNGHDPTGGSMVVDVDLDAQRHMIKPLRDAGHIVVCYFSVGTAEYWRKDVKENLATWKRLCTQQMKHFKECWLDISQLGALQALQRPRFERAAKEGCHAVEPDNVDCYQNARCYRHFASSSKGAKPAQLAFNKWYAGLAHSLGMGVALKNAVQLIPDTHQWYDFAVNEQCQPNDECGDENKYFVRTGRLVAHVEYTGPGSHRCEVQKEYGLMTKWCDGSDTDGICGDADDDDATTPWHDCFQPVTGSLPPIEWTSRVPGV